MAEGDIEVLVNAAGAEEAQEDIEGVEQSIEEAGEGMEDTGEQMEGMTRQMKGLGATLAASLAVASAGLLAQVPVLGEALGGLSAIVSALAYQMDGVLRPVVEPAADWFYDLSAAIFQLDGAAGAAVGVVGVLASALGLAAGAAASFGLATGGITGAVSSVTTLFATLGGVIKTAAVAIGSAVAASTALAAAVGALIGILGVLALDELGVLDWFYNLGQETREVYDKHMANLKESINDVIGLATNAVSGAFDWLIDALANPEETVTGILNTLQEIASKTWDSVVEISMRVLQSGGDPGGVLGTGVGPTVGPNADPRDWDILGGKTGGMIESGGLMNVHAGEGIVRKAEINRRDKGFTADRGDAPPVVRMDGRRLTQQDSRYRRNGTASRGRNG